MKNYKINIPITDATLRGIKQATEQNPAEFQIFKNSFILNAGTKTIDILQYIAHFDRHASTNSDTLTIERSITNFEKLHPMYYEIINNRTYNLCTLTDEQTEKIQYFQRYQRNEKIIYFDRLDRSSNGKYYNNLVPIYGNYERTDRPFTKNGNKWTTSKRKQYQTDGTPRTTAENIELANAWQQFEKTLTQEQKAFFINSEQIFYICPHCGNPSRFNFNACNCCGYEITDEQKQAIKNQMTEIF